MARTGMADGHDHQINLSKTSGKTGPAAVDGHTHVYSLLADKTEEAQGGNGLHKHTIPKA